MSVNTIQHNVDKSVDYYTDEACYNDMLYNWKQPRRRPKYLTLSLTDWLGSNKTILILLQLFAAYPPTSSVVKNNVLKHVLTTGCVNIQIQGQRLYNVLFVLWTFRMLSCNRNAIRDFGSLRYHKCTSPPESHVMCNNILHLQHFINTLTFMKVNDAILALLHYQSGIQSEYRGLGEGVVTSRLQTVSNMHLGDISTSDTWESTSIRHRTILKLSCNYHKGLSHGDWINSLYYGCFSKTQLQQFKEKGLFETLFSKRGSNPVINKNNLSHLIEDKEISASFSGTLHHSNRPINFYFSASTSPNFAHLHCSSKEHWDRKSSLSYEI